MYRRIVVWMFAVVMLITALPSGNVQAARGIAIFVNNKQVPDSELTSMVSQGSILVPFRQVFKKLGLIAAWDEDKQQIQGTSDKLTLTMRVGDATATLNDKTVKLAAKPVKSNGTVYVPLTNIAQAAGYAYDWDDVNRIVNLLSTAFNIKQNDRDREYSGYSWYERLLFANASDENMIPVRVKGKWGYINILGETVINPQYTYAGSFNSGLAVVEQNKRLIVINKRGKQPFDLKNYSVFGYYGGVASAKNLTTNKYGLVDTNGKFILAPEYNDMSRFYQGIARVEKGDKWGLINSMGKLITKLEYDEMEYPDSRPAVKLLSVRKGKLWGVVDYEGKLVIPVKYNSKFDFSTVTHQDLFSRKENGFTIKGYIDTNGNETPYTENYGFGEISENGIYLVRNYGSSPYYVYASGERPFDLNLQDAGPFNEGLAPVKMDNKWGYIGQDGTFSIPAQYEEAGDFQNDLVVVKKNGKYGVIDKNNGIVIPFTYEEMSPLLDNKQWIYNLQTYSNVEFVKNSLFQVKKSGKWGLIDQNGKSVLPNIYTTENSHSTVYVEILNYYRDLDIELAYVKLSDRYNAYKTIDVRNGKVIFPNFNNVFYLGQGIFTGKSENMKDNAYSIMNSSGKVLFRAES